MPTLIHLSDFHFGSSYVPKLGEAILNDIAAINPDVVIISGDLTLRARPSEFQQARGYLSRISKPMLVIPGNHDQVVLNPLERLVAPLAQYRKYIYPQTDSTLQANGFFVVGLNDNRPILPGGFWSREQQEWLARELARAPREAVRVVVTHHQMMWDGWKPAGFWHSTHTLEFLARCGVDLVLNGHTHIPNVTRTQEGIVVSRASTATCTRTRQGQGNSYNLITFDDKEVSVCIRRYDTRAERFIAAQATTFPRRQRSAA